MVPTGLTMDVHGTSATPRAREQFRRPRRAAGRISPGLPSPTDGDRRRLREGQPVRQRRLDAILHPSYVDNIGAKPDDHLRSMKVECTEVENELSYVRRLAQARIDILDDEHRRRASGRSDENVVVTLRRVLSQGASRPAEEHSRLVDVVAALGDIPWVRGREHLIRDSTLIRLPDLSDEELGHALEELHALEHEVTDQRRQLHVVIDRLNSELARR